ncbi:hypothetical protein PRIPAC_85681 [Pristionchus pacificus]|uniref:Uncharacterized protein n=1 Tax=Pristionchus pacificus TaxID=54126 RepID=A0A2A6BTZ6_PRIPA|nr:hypothetical protein PRIPAC_85681 [Pristionchus pacificus]|eukprot:PDM69452.1 hypothetical protein PRIPAC_44548 [Pristionchus pacificus]
MGDNKCGNGMDGEIEKGGVEMGERDDSKCANSNSIPTSHPLVSTREYASYHSRVLDKMPTTNDRKAVISDWLVRKGIDCPAGLKKKELVDKLKKLSRKEHNIYIVDKMAEDYGVTLVRTPPYMAEFAPIELGWSAMKRAQYDLINRTDDGRVIREKLLEWMENYPAEKCKSYMEHSRKKRIAEGGLTFSPPSLTTEEVLAAAAEVVDDEDEEAVEDLDDIFDMFDEEEEESIRSVEF